MASVKASNMKLFASVKSHKLTTVMSFFTNYEVEHAGINLEEEHGYIN